MALALQPDSKLAKEKKKSSMAGLYEEDEEELSIRIGRAGVHSGKLFFTIPQSALSLNLLTGGKSTAVDVCQLY